MTSFCTNSTRHVFPFGGICTKIGHTIESRSHDSGRDQRNAEDEKRTKDEDDSDDSDIIVLN